MLLAGTLALAGCGKPQADTQPAMSDSPAAAPVAAQQPAAPVEPVAPAKTNETLSGAAEFATKSLASPFAGANLALKESYDRALIAYQVGDYARAVAELDDLANTPELTPAQQEGVKDLLAKTLKMAPNLAATRKAGAAAAAQSETPPQFPVAVPGASDSPKNVLESPFSTADPAVRESFARAKAAYDIGDYPNALAELKALVNDPQLNYQQKYAAQSLLDKIPQAAPAAPPEPPAQVPRR